MIGPTNACMTPGTLLIRSHARLHLQRDRRHLGLYFSADRIVLRLRWLGKLLDGAAQIASMMIGGVVDL